MSNRRQVFSRLWALVWQFTVGYIATIVITTVAVIWAVIDLLWQLVVGSNGLDERSSIAKHIDNAFHWSAGQTVYAVTGGGDGRFRWFWTS